MRPIRPLFCLAASSVLALSAAGCSTSSDSRPACPDVLVLADAATMTAFVPDRGTDVLDVDHEVAIADVLSGCKIDRSDRAHPVLTVAVAPVLVVNRGPANTDGQAAFSFFVSVVSRSDSIANKNEFPVTVTFEGNRNRVVLREDDPPVTVNIPLVGGPAPLDYEVLVGLQLTPQQLEYNQARRAAVR
jgi:hypothetical protein